MRKILIIATVVLFFILALIFTLNSLKKPPSQTEPTTIVPTTVPFETFNKVEVINAAQTIAPFETENFRFDYSPSLDKMVVTEKTNDGYQEYVGWISENGLPELVGNPELVAFEDETTDQLSTGSTNSSVGLSSSSNGSLSSGVEKQDFDPLIEFLNIFLNFGQGLENIQITPNPSNPTQPTQPTLPQSGGEQPSGKLTYYAQCNGYGNISLPSGCNLCQSGCGPTTVAMIASSYLGNQYDPQAIVNLYKNKGYFLGCGGSVPSNAKAALESLGLKTTTYMSYSEETADQVAPDFKKYIDAGWTIFAYGDFKEGPTGGHFFWITDVQGGNIMAYDPYYGKSSTPPINENDRYPFPKYKGAFGVKK